MLRDKHPLTIAKKRSKKKGGQPKSPKKPETGGATSGGLSLAALRENFTKLETSATDPTQAIMAQLLKKLFQGKV
jgi:hypothetical protein